MGSYLLTIIPKEKRLSFSQIKTIVNILVDIGVVGFGTIFVPAFLGKGSGVEMAFGLILCLTSWYTALRLSKNP